MGAFAHYTLTPRLSNHAAQALSNLAARFSHKPSTKVLSSDDAPATTPDDVVKHWQEYLYEVRDDRKSFPIYCFFISLNRVDYFVSLRVKAVEALYRFR